MPVSWSRTYVRRVYPTNAQIEARVLDVAQRYATFGVREVQKRIWYHGRFVYRHRNPKPSRSRSADAWMGFAERTKRGEIVVVLQNPATDRRGVNYPKYVHLAGKSPSDRLMGEVHDLMAREIAPKMADSVALAVVDELSRAGTKTTTFRAG